MTEFQTLELTVTDGVAVVTFTRPDKMNTFTPLGMLELMEAFDITDADDAVKAVIVTGSGRAFCAGADLSEGGNTFNYHKRDASEQIMVNGIRRDGGGRVSLRIFNSLKPVIAACNGAAVGVGATMQLPMDFRLASNTARYGFVFARRGIVPEACSSWFLPRLVGMSTALEWVYSGRVFNADEALAKGLVQSLHAPEDLMPAALEFSRKLTEASAPVSVALSRQMLWRGFGASHPMEGHIMESRALASRGKNTDTAEGVAAFKEKRDAQFPNTVSGDYPDIFDPEPEFR